MPKATITFDTVRKLGLALPGVEEGTVYGSPALKANGRMFACVAIHRSAEPDTLAVRMPFKERDRLIAADPDTYYLTDHYVNYPVVLVRLARSSREVLRELLHTGWTFVSTGAKVSPRRGTHARRR
ncbi:MAG: MmcQ/YjbR family DNA-binding protein [Longimicrobiales bacterium]